MQKDVDDLETIKEVELIRSDRWDQKKKGLRMTPSFLAQALEVNGITIPLNEKEKRRKAGVMI